MKKNESIKTIMSDSPITGTINEKFSAVVKKMEEGGIHHLPIVSGTDLVGIISSTDITRRSFSDLNVSSNASTNESLDHTVKIEDIMQKDVVSLKDTDTVRHAADILMKNEFNSIEFPPSILKEEPVKLKVWSSAPVSVLKSTELPPEMDKSGDVNDNDC